MSELRDLWAATLIRDRSIPHACARTAWALREYVNEQGSTIVNTRTIAKDTGQNLRHVKRHIALLVERGYLARFDRGGNGYGRSWSARTQIVVPGLLFDASTNALLDGKTVAATATVLDGKTVANSGRKGGNLGPKGWRPPPPRTHVTHITPGADARASPRGSRAAPKIVGTPTDPLVLARSLIAAPGIPYPDDYIAEKCGVTQEQIDQLRGYCRIVELRHTSRPRPR